MTDETKESVQRQLNEMHLLYLRLNNSLSSARERQALSDAYLTLATFAKIYLRTQ